MLYLIIGVFILGYFCIAMEHPLKVNKTATALILATVIWVLYVIAGESIYEITGFAGAYESFKEANPNLGFMDYLSHHQLIEHLGDTAEILFFLLGAMTIVEIVDRHQGFRIITDKIKTTNKRKLIWILSFLTFFLSAILDNLTTAIVMCALLRKLIDDKKERWFFAGMVILAANSGGAWSPIGDVTTIMLWIGGQVTASNIILKVFVPSIISMVIPLIGISMFLKGNVTKPALPESQGNNEVSSKQSLTIFCIGIGALLFTPIFKTLTHLPPYLGMLFGLGVLWIVTEIMHRKKDPASCSLGVHRIIEHIDTPSILFFLGILMAVAGLQSIGILNMFSITLDNAFSGNIYAINLVIGALSSVVDNVPLVAGTMGMYSLDVYHTDHAFWELLAYCAGTGGSILIIGSAAGVAIMGMEKIDFIWYMKKVSIWAIVGYLAGAGAFYLMNILFFNHV